MKLTGRCGELSAEIAEWKCRLDDALRLAESKESELHSAAADHVTDVDRWSEKVEQLMSRNCELETSAADGKRELMDAELRESLLRQNVDELTSQLNTAAQTRDQLNSQLSEAQHRLHEVQCPHVSVLQLSP